MKHNDQLKGLPIPKWEWVTPELATQYLKKNLKNRQVVSAVSAAGGAGQHAGGSIADRESAAG